MRKRLLFPLLIILAAFFAGCADPNGPGDETIAPVLIDAAVSNLSSPDGSTATLKFTSDEAGTFYCVVQPTAAAVPSVAAIKAEGDSAAARVGVNTLAVTELMAGTEYKAYIVAVDAVGNHSEVLTIGGFTPVSTTPVLSGTVTISPNSNVTPGTPLSAAYSGNETGITWQWIKGGADILGEAGQTYTPTKDGTYAVRASASGFQSKTSDAVTVTGVPVLSGSITITPNGSVKINIPLTAFYDGNEPGALSAQWRKDGEDIPNATGGIYTPTESGSYTLTVSIPGYQSKTSEAVIVSFHAIDWTLMEKIWNDTDGGFWTVAPSGLTITGPSSLIALYTEVANGISTGEDIALDLSACTMPAQVPYFSTNSIKDSVVQRFVSVTLPASVTSTDGGAFSIFTKLRSITAPGLITIGDLTFYECPNLTSVNLPAVTSVGIGTFFKCTGLVSVNLQSAKTFGNATFRSCTSLKTVSLPSATTFGNLTFAECTSLTTVTLGATRPTIGANTLYYTGSTPALTIKVPNSSVSAYNTWKTTNATNLDIPYGKTVTISAI
jgi:hypothetical protein